MEKLTLLEGLVWQLRCKFNKMQGWIYENIESNNMSNWYTTPLWLNNMSVKVIWLAVAISWHNRKELISTCKNMQVPYGSVNSQKIPNTTNNTLQCCCACKLIFSAKDSNSFLFSRKYTSSTISLWATMPLLILFYSAIL